MNKNEVFVDYIGYAEKVDEKVDISIIYHACKDNGILIFSIFIVIYEFYYQQNLYHLIKIFKTIII